MNRALLQELVAVAAQLASIAARLAESADDPDDHLSLEEARLLARLKTTRPIVDAIRSRDLVAFGKQRSRTVRRADVTAWIESRRVKPFTVGDDPRYEADIRRRMRNIRARKRKAGDT